MRVGRPLLTALLLSGALGDIPALAQGPSAVLGGSSRDTVFDVALDGAGNIYLTGETYSSDFPVAGGVQGTLRGTADAFVIKLNPNATQVVYSTYLGGGGFDSGRGIAVDAAGNAYVVGYTESADFPRQAPLDANRGGFSDAFIVKLNTQGNAILFSTYFGGGFEDTADAVALDGQGRVYVAGRTTGGLATISAAQAIYGGNQDAFVARLNAGLTAYEYVTYLGGNFLDLADAIDVDATGRACVAGITSSTTLPLSNAPQGTPGGAQDAFFALLDASGSSLLLSSYLGGTGPDRARGVSCTTARLAVAGDTQSTDFPTGTTGSNPVQAVLGGERDAFLAVFDLTALPTVTREFSTLIGDRRDDTLADVDIAGTGDITVFGDTTSSGLPEVGGTATGLTGAGIFRSTDGGVTWQPSGLLGMTINGFAAAPAAPARLLAGTDRGLHVSTDNGVSWERQTTGLPARAIHGVVVSPASPCTWIIGIDSAPADGATPIGAARTTDCGVTWTPWGFPAQRFKRLHWLVNQARIVVTVDRAQPFSGGTQHDTCVVTDEGVQVRCFGNGTSDNVIAIDSTDACRWFEANASGSVWQVSGNAFGCDHPFSVQGLGASLGSAVTALATTTVLGLPVVERRHADALGERVLFAGTTDRRVLRTLPDVTPATWLPTSVPISYPASGLAVASNGTLTVSAGPEALSLDSDGSGFTVLTSDTGASGFRQSITIGSTLFGATAQTRDLFVQKFLGTNLSLAASFYTGSLCDDEGVASAHDAVALYLSAQLLESCSLFNRGAYLSASLKNENVTVTKVPRSGQSPNVILSRDRFYADGGFLNVGLHLGARFVGVNTDASGWVTRIDGNGLYYVTFVLDENPSAQPRTATLTFEDPVAGTVTFTVSQDGTSPRCASPPTPDTISLPAAGGQVRYPVSAPAGCSVNAAIEEAWARVVAYAQPASSVSGSGSGTLTIEADANAGPGRFATLDLAGYSVTVVQAAADGAVTDRTFLAEGATSTFFDARIAIANPSSTTAVVATATFDTAQGQSFAQSALLPPLGRATIIPAVIPGLEQAEFSAAVAADGDIVAARLMQWDASAYGSHAESGLGAPTTTWYLAEGATHSGFELFYLLQNPGSTAAQVEVRYLRPAPLAVVVKSYAVPARSRFNIWVNQEGPELANTDVSAIISSTNGVPIAVERAMYLSGQGRIFNAGHDSAGIPAPSTQWFLAEGATGPYLDLYVLVANATAQAAPIAVQYLLTDGTVIDKSYVVPANSRFTIWVDGEDARLADAEMSTTVVSTSGVPIVVERALWWPGSFATWHEGHNSAGATLTGTRWAVAEGEVGGATAFETYVLIANVSAFAGAARVTLLFEGEDPVSRTFQLPPTSRTNVAVAVEFPEAAGKRFGVLVESLGVTPPQLVVEEAIYSDSGGVKWAAGSNLLATRLP